MNVNLTSDIEGQYAKTETDDKTDTAKNDESKDEKMSAQKCVEEN